MKKAKLQRSVPRRPRELLRHAEMRAVAIRKLLKNIEQSVGQGARGIMGDAVSLVETIERLARLGQTSAAEDAVELEFHIEVLTSHLEGAIDQIIAS